MDQKPRHLLIGETKGMEHDRPINAVRGDEDVFANDMEGGPLFPELVRLLGEVFLLPDRSR